MTSETNSVPFPNEPEMESSAALSTAEDGEVNADEEYRDEFWERFDRWNSDYKDGTL